MSLNFVANTFIRKQVYVDLSIGLVPNGQQAIPRTNTDQVSDAILRH